MGNAAVSGANPFGCCLVTPKVPCTEAEFLKTPANKVELAVSVLGGLGGLPGLTAYHTSIAVNGEEFFFSPLGVQRNRGLESHRRIGPDGEPVTPLPNGGEKQGLKVMEMGMTARSPDSIYQILAPYFEPGSYDLLHKNCNTFTDVALFFLIGQRLDTTYNAIERVGANNPRLLEQVTGGAYVSNPRALEFNLEQALKALGEAEEESGGLLPNGQRRLSLGTVARIHGLQNALAQHLNGKAGVVQRYNVKNSRYEVHVGNEVKSFRPDNLEPFVVAQEMVIVDLKSESAKHLNGELCKILKFNAQTERLEVQILSSGEVKALKFDNVQRP